MAFTSLSKYDAQTVCEIMIQDSSAHRAPNNMNASFHFVHEINSNDDQGVRPQSTSDSNVACITSQVVNNEGSSAFASTADKFIENSNTAKTTSVPDAGPEMDAPQPQGRSASVYTKSNLIARWKRIRTFLISYHLPLMVLFGVVIGGVWPLPGKAVGDAKLGEGVCLISESASPSGTVKSATCVWATISSLCVTTIFFISGLQLKLAKMKEAVTAKKEIALGLFLIFILTASFGYAVAAGPKLSPPEFSFGLALFCIMPTTLSSCVVITGYAGGNVALALFLSVVTNLLGTAILPLTVGWLADVFTTTMGGSTAGPSVGIDAVDLCLSLVFTVLIPLLVGMGMRIASPKRIGKFVDRHSLAFKLLSALALAMIPWMKISQSAELFKGVPAEGYVLVILCAVGLHLFFLAISYVFSVYIFTLRGLEEEKCLAFVCSQKTLPIALSVIEAIPDGVLGSKGLISIPVILAQLFQTLFDSFLAVKWNLRTKKEHEFLSAN